MASTYLKRGTISTPTNNTKGTFSCWFKRGNLTNQTLFCGGTDIGVTSGTKDMRIYIASSGTTLNFYQDDYSVTGNNTYNFPNILRDTNAWYHLVVAIDTTQSTNADKVKFYLNGTQLTANNISVTESFTNLFFNTSGLYQIIGVYN